MSEDVRLSFHREIAASEFGWQADLSDALHADETLDQTKIDKVLLDGKWSPRYTIGTDREITMCLAAAGITMDPDIQKELHSFIMERLPDTHTEPTEISSDPVQIVKYDQKARGGGKNSRTQYALRVGSSPVAIAERKALVTATQRFCGLKQSPPDVWLPPHYVEGLQLGRGRSLAELAIMRAAVVTLQAAGPDGTRLLPKDILIDQVESNPSIEELSSE